MNYWYLKLERDNLCPSLYVPSLYLVKGEEPYQTLAGSIDGTSWSPSDFSISVLFLSPPGRRPYDWEDLGKEILVGIKEGKPIQTSALGLTLSLWKASENEATMIMFHVKR